MAKLKQQISDFRQSTPKHIQWLLLVAALIVVIILLTLLFTGRKSKHVVTIGDDNDAEPLMITTDPSSINWQRVAVGEKKSETVKISATQNIKIDDIKIVQAPDGLTVNPGTCKTMDTVSAKSPCTFYITYAPTKADDDTEYIVLITYKPNESEFVSDVYKQEYQYKLRLSAIDAPVKKKTETESQPVVASIPAEEPEPEPVVEPEPKSESIEESDSEPIYVPVTKPEPVFEPEPAVEPTPSLRDIIRNDIEDFSKSSPFDSDFGGKDAPATSAASCSRFAMPGYNASGRQIGWIKPERGAYYFHPFSDTNCDTPTGIYNPENGIITDINDNSKRLGTDSDHRGFTGTANAVLPQLSNPATAPRGGDVEYSDNYKIIVPERTGFDDVATGGSIRWKKSEISEETFTGSGADSAVYSTQPYDRRFILRQYKPIPATIVSEVRADPSLYDSNSGNIQLPVRATVDRNVYADNGRTIIIPTGTLLMGYVSGTLPGPYTAIGRMQIKWYQFILPNGVEFNFNGEKPFSGDSQGRAGVPGRGSTDYLEQFVMPMITAIVPAAVNMIAPVADKFVNQIDLDNNTVVQSGTMRSSELAKNEIITAWNQVAQKLMVDMMDNTVPPFSIAAGTRITVYSPEDLIVTCTGQEGKACNITPKTGHDKRVAYNSISDKSNAGDIHYSDGSWTGQVRSFNWANEYCNNYKDGKMDDATIEKIYEAGLDYSTVLFYCQSNQYKAINNAKQDAYYTNQKTQFQSTYAEGSTGVDTKDFSGGQKYNQEVLGLKYDSDGQTIKNPFASESKPAAEQTTEAPSIGCLDGTKPDANGCCTGETFENIGNDEWACCPADGGDCFPPIL